MFSLLCVGARGRAYAVARATSTAIASLLKGENVNPKLSVRPKFNLSYKVSLAFSATQFSEGLYFTNDL